MNLHSRIHYQIRQTDDPIKCPRSGCKTTFTRECHLREHLKIHRNRLLRCLFCPCRFIKADRLTVSSIERRFLSHEIAVKVKFKLQCQTEVQVLEKCSHLSRNSHTFRGIFTPFWEYLFTPHTCTVAAEFSICKSGQ